MHKESDVHATLKCERFENRLTASPEAVTLDLERSTVAEAAVVIFNFPQNIRVHLQRKHNFLGVFSSAFVPQARSNL